MISDIWYFVNLINLYLYSHMKKQLDIAYSPAPALKELTNMAAMLDFVLISTLYEKFRWWKYTLVESMALTKCFNNMMIMAYKWFSDIMVAILDLWW